MTRVLGLDPGLATAGWAYRDDLFPGAPWRAGVWRTSPADGDAAQRMALLLNCFRALATSTGAEVLAMETQYLRPDKPGGVGRSVLLVARVAGAMVGIARERGLGVVEITPQRAKLALAGKGNADKREMVRAANRAYGLNLLLKDEHAADALGMALAGEGEWRLQRAERAWARQDPREFEEQYMGRPTRTAAQAHEERQPGAGTRPRVKGPVY